MLLALEGGGNSVGLCPGEGAVWGQHCPPRPGGAGCGATTAEELQLDPPWGLFIQAANSPCRLPLVPDLVLLSQPEGPSGLMPGQ